MIVVRYLSLARVPGAAGEAEHGTGAVVNRKPARSNSLTRKRTRLSYLRRYAVRAFNQDRSRVCRRLFVYTSMSAIARVLTATKF